MKPRSIQKTTAGLTLLEVLVIIAILAVLAGLLLPAHFGGGPAKIMRCANNLRQIGVSFYIWADDNNGKFPMQVSVTNGGTSELVPAGIVFVNFLALSNYCKNPRFFVCPADNLRTVMSNYNSGFGNANLSYVLNVDAAFGKINNAATLLSGDRNLAVNGRQLRRGFAKLTNFSSVSWTTNVHPSFGNLSFTDGRVEMARAGKLRQVLQATGMDTNRLVLP